MRCFVKVIVFVTTVLILPPLTSSHTCDSLEQELPQVLNFGADTATVRRVESGGIDNTSCLNEENNQNPPPCATLDYALHTTQEPESRVPQENLLISVGAGIHRPTGNSAITVIDSNNITITGSGQGKTIFNCGNYGEDKDFPCSYMNLQIRNSINVRVSGFTFTRCGPITSAVYIASSEYVVIEQCEFRDNISPPLLVYNTSPFVLNRTKFISNHPYELNDTITTDVCYFSGGVDVFFLDNRTSSGGISHYSEGESTLLSIIDCEFYNNSARPDETVSLPRESEGYGHGGAANIRLSNSSNGQICIRNCIFEENAAEAQAGAVALTIGGSSIYNSIELDNCQFTNNSCTLKRCAGGAVAIDFFSDTLYNEILIKGTGFIKNNARDGMGGAISLSTTVNVMSDDSGRSDALLLEDCLFQENEAFYDGTAVGVFSLTHTDQIGLPVNITDCHFLNNTATRGSADSTALTAYRVLLRFNNRSSFVSNQGGGISLLGSRMDIIGEVKIDKNVAVFGAGIAMTARSLLLLYEGAFLSFTNNLAVDEGAGMYVEYTSSDFVLAILNRGCFIQYFTRHIDLPPNQWNASVEFVNNSAGMAGAAIYANDMSRCKWLGDYTDDNNSTEFIFNPPSDYQSPFVMKNNTVRRSNSNEGHLATDASTFFATTDYGDNPVVGFGEKISFHLNSIDQLDNFRESVWSFNTEYQNQILGALSSNDSLFEYEIPSKQDLTQDEQTTENINITVEFSLLRGQASVTSVVLQIQGCHPGYQFDQKTQSCVCDYSNSIVIQCNEANRYFYARDGYWVGLNNDLSLISSTTVPGFLNCTRQGALPGCEIHYDSLEEQCAQGREGTLCGECKNDYGVTFDLRFCRHCGGGGIFLFVFICVVTIIVAAVIVFFNVSLPDEVKGFVFFAQVIGLIYRNAPYLIGQNNWYTFFDFIINLLGFSLPFQVCPAENVPAFGIALLGFVPPLLATSVAFIYVVIAKRSKRLSERSTFNGFHFLFVFVYKYFLDTSFIFISCTLLGDNYVFIYQGTLQCFEYPFLILFIVGLVFLIGLGIVLPSFLLYLVYRPGKHVQAADALTCGLKRKRRYRWYGVWDVWRRILFVAANLFISVTTRNVVLMIHCLLIIISLSIVCFVKPYKKAHNNILEALILLCLLGATLAILDDDDVNVGNITSIVFAILPFLYIIIYTLYRVGKYTISWIKAKTEAMNNKGERTKLDIQMKRLTGKYKQLMESKPIIIVKSMVDIMTDQNQTTQRDSSRTTDQSSSLPSQRSFDKDRDDTEGSEQTILDNNGIELLYRSGTISAELREPLLDEEHT